MNTALLLALINDVALPELAAWLRARHAAGASTITDADVLAKLATDTDFIITAGNAWLAAHPPTA